MFEKYEACEYDFKAIEEGIKTVWEPKMDFVFKEKALIEKINVISYDSQSLYLWSKQKFPKLISLPCKLNNYYAYKIPHKVELEDNWQGGWKTGLPNKQLMEYLPQQSNIISGGLLAPFLKLQQSKTSFKPNPYIKEEGYLATIVHEFGHLYYREYKLWYYSDKEENLKYLKIAQKLFENQKSATEKIRIPYPLIWSEVFAFCADYYASYLFWPNHNKDIDIMNVNLIKQAKQAEKSKDLGNENSLFDDNRTSHLTAAIFGKIIISRFPNNWPPLLLNPLKI